MLAKRGHTEAYFSPEAKTYADSFRDPANGWIAVYLQLNVIGYNSKLVPRSEAPKGYEDLLNAKWKGRMGLDDKQYIWYDGMLKVLGREKGLAYMKRLAGGEQIGQQRAQTKRRTGGLGRDQTDDGQCASDRDR